MLRVHVWLHYTLKQRELLVEVKYLRVQRSHRIQSCLINKSPSIKIFTEPQVKCMQCCIMGAFELKKD